MLYMIDVESMTGFVGGIVILIVWTFVMTKFIILPTMNKLENKVDSIHTKVWETMKLVMDMAKAEDLDNHPIIKSDIQHLEKVFYNGRERR